MSSTPNPRVAPVATTAIGCIVQPNPASSTCMELAAEPSHSQTALSCLFYELARVAVPCIHLQSCPKHLGTRTLGSPDHHSLYCITPCYLQGCYFWTDRLSVSTRPAVQRLVTISDRAVAPEYCGSSLACARIAVNTSRFAKPRAVSL